MKNGLIRGLIEGNAKALPKQNVLQEKGEKMYGSNKTFFSAFKTPIGIEIEVERFDPVLWGGSMYWQIVKDGSLKDHGWELVSVPVAGKNIDYALSDFSERMRHQKPLWSHRCSIHVHINVRNWTIEKTRVLVGTYAVFEDLFFSLVDPIRKAGSYCYPIRDLSPQGVLFGHHDGKYCALNTSASVSKYGTVEFRHMHGTSDIKAIRRWIQLIVKLHAYVHRTNLNTLKETIANLNTTSHYHQFLTDVFGLTAGIFPQEVLQRSMEEGVLWAKAYFFSGGNK